MNKINTVYCCDPLAWDVYMYFYFSMEIQDVGKFSVSHYSVQTNIDLLDNVVLCV